MLKGCIIRRFYGIYCPGCGGTRAVRAFLQGQFVDSFLYHPIVLYVAVIFLYCLLFRKKPKVTYLYIALGIVILNCIVRNVLLLVFHIETI